MQVSKEKVLRLLQTTLVKSETEAIVNYVLLHLFRVDLVECDYAVLKPFFVRKNVALQCAAVEDTVSCFRLPHYACAQKPSYLLDCCLCHKYYQPMTNHLVVVL